MGRNAVWQKKNKMHKTHLWCNTNAKFPKIESQKPKKSLILFRNAKDIDLSKLGSKLSQDLGGYQPDLGGYQQDLGGYQNNINH